MRLTVRLVFAVLMLVTAACSQVAAQTSAQAPPQPAAQAPAPTPAAPAQIPAPNPFDAFQQFSASMSGSPAKFNKMKIYRSGNQMRADWAYVNEYRISNLADRNGWVIRPMEWVKAPKECRRMSLMDLATYPFFAYSGGDFNVERSPTVEEETLNGHSCKVENYTFRAKDGRPQVKAKLWEAEDLKGFPIQIEVEPSVLKKFTMNYTDVSLEPPDAKLFRLPALCHAGTNQKKKQPASTSKTPNQASPKPPQ